MVRSGNSHHHMSSAESFGLFIVTRNRSVILRNTLDAILSQTLLPCTILIVDNSDNNATAQMLEEWGNSRIQYHAIGFNAGPAGASKVGMEKLFGQGLEWVMWGDDDDPPKFSDLFESLMKVAGNVEKRVGIVGAVGVRFNKSRGVVVRINDTDLNGSIEVDNVAGGMFPAIHRRVFEAGIVPDPELFFGFEELDFCLSVRRAGFTIIVPGYELFRHRSLAGHMGKPKKFYKQKQAGRLWREYYSVRNLLHILLRKEKAVNGACILVVRSIAKSVYGFRFGFLYGRKNFFYIFRGLFDAFRKKLGLTLEPGMS